MTQTKQILALLSEKLRPTQIARQLRVPPKDVIDHLKKAVHDGHIQRTEILHTWDASWRNLLDFWKESGLDLHWQVQILRIGLGDDLDIDELELFHCYQSKQPRLGDIYVLLADLERTLHANIKLVMLKHFGRGEDGWWRKGVPENVRRACVESRERDSDFSSDHAYCYTTLIHLSDIMKKNWQHFTELLPGKNKKKLEEDLRRLNSIRNRVMHPVRAEQPTEDDYEFVKSAYRDLRMDRWRLKGNN
jgi:hypothetical protein